MGIKMSWELEELDEVFRVLNHVDPTNYIHKHLKEKILKAVKPALQAQKEKK